MNYILGLVVASIAIMLALSHLGQGASDYWDFVAFAMVLGGTMSVSVIVMPWSLYKVLYAYFKKLVFNWQPNRQVFVRQCLGAFRLYKSGAKIDNLSTKSFEERLLADGFELLNLGVKPERVQTILTERIYHYSDIGDQVSGSVLSLAKYPPAFGLTGTVLGLVELMKGVSAGMPAKETGVKMAIALVATMYGLLVANLVINPAGEQIRKIVYMESKLAEIAMQTVLMASEDIGLLEAQEMLNSMVFENERVDVLGTNAVLDDAA